MPPGFESKKSANNLGNAVEEVVDDAVHEVEARLLENEGKFQSTEEKDGYLRKLYAALAVSNNAYVRDLIKYIEEWYGKVGE
jgi:hypothetical protein